MRRLTALMILVVGVTSAGAETLRGNMRSTPVTRATGDALAETIGRSLP